MASQNQAYIEIDEAILAYIDESEQSNHKYFKLWNLAFRILTELGLDFFYQIRSVRLPVNANKTVTIPTDYLNYSKIGVFNEIGEVIPLFYNSKLTTYADLNPNRKAKTEDNKLFNNFIFNSPVFYNYWNGYWFNNLYGVPSGSPFIGTFKIDTQNNVILLSENFCYDYICLEYVASPVEGQPYFFPIQFKEAMISGLAWLDIRSIPSSRRGNLGDKRDRRHEFYNQRRLARARWKPFYLDEAYEFNLRSQRLTVKM
jgi:hypothetical protein